MISNAQQPFCCAVATNKKAEVPQCLLSDSLSNQEATNASKAAKKKACVCVCRQEEDAAGEFPSRNRREEQLEEDVRHRQRSLRVPGRCRASDPDACGFDWVSAMEVSSAATQRHCRAICKSRFKG